MQWFVLFVFVLAFACFAVYAIATDKWSRVLGIGLALMTLALVIERLGGIK